jgi:hypothetical protein
VEPDLVERMKSGGLSDGYFVYGPSFPVVFREPFSNERHLFSDSQLHCCRPYLELEKKFFDDNAAIVRENYFDADLLLDVDPAEDLAVEEVVDYDDLVPAISVEEIVWQVAAVDHIASIENEETTERVTSPVVVAAGSGLVDAVGEGRAGAPSDPGPSDGSVRVDDFLPGPRPGPVASMTSSDVASDEVILISFFDFLRPFWCLIISVYYCG